MIYLTVKKTGRKICKLNIDNYYDSTNYIKEKIYIKFRDNLIEKIKRNLKIIVIWKYLIIF